MFRAKLLLAAAIVLFATWFAATNTYGFDIAIYKDPLSYLNERYLWGKRFHGYTGNYAQFMADTGYTANGAEWMSNVYSWYRDMGVTKVMVNYIYPANFNDIPQDCTHIQVMNWFYPGLNKMYGEKYVDAQFRDVQVGVNGAFWSFSNSIPNPNWRTQQTFRNDLGNSETRSVVGMSGSPDTLWRATSELGKFSGWDGLQTGFIDSSWYMPMHYRLTWAVDPVGNITTNTPIADFYWIVRAPNDEDGNANWWRFPVQTLKLNRPNGLADTLNWIMSDFYEDAVSGTYTLLDQNFDSLRDNEWQDVRFGPACLPNSLDEQIVGLSYGAYTDVRMSVHYCGTHNFYLNRVEVYDEGAWRMFASPDSAHWADSIKIAFQNEYSTYANGRSCGWYYDEWDGSGIGNGDPVLRSIVKVNKILQNANPPLPTFFVNGEWGSDTWDNAPRNDLFRELNSQDVHLLTNMQEFYFLGGGHCIPNRVSSGQNPFPRLFTTSASDTDYFAPYECGTDFNGYPLYDGFMSLQCSIDGFLWDWYPICSRDSSFMSEYPPDATGAPMNYHSLVFQTEFVHRRVGEKIWALLQGGQDMPPDCTNNCCPIRVPMPNEVKLGAWLAIACDVDGIMWYPWDFGGLIDFANGTFDTTERYAGAKKACRDIKQIAPILESLEFVKTYASRAFEMDYPDSTYEAIQRDVIAANSGWYGQPYRCVEEIVAYPPDGSGWSQTAENHPYVQVSRFRNPVIDASDPTQDDYWFLIVNRRALEEERRKIRLVIQVDSAHTNSYYYVDYILGDSMRSAPPCAERVPWCAIRYLDVVLQPGEAELVHFYRGESGCDTNLAHIDSLTVIPYNNGAVKLNWNEATETIEGYPFQADMYFILGSPRFQGPYTPIDTTSSTSYIDSIFVAAYPRYYYQVQACGNAAPGQVRIREKTPGSSERKASTAMIVK